MRRDPWVLAALALLALLPLAAGHGDEHAAEQLVEEGTDLMLGSYRAPQPGPLVVLPLGAARGGCGVAGAPFVLDLGTARLGLAWNATHLVAVVVPDANATGFLAVGVDTNDAVRSLLLMQEHAVALHATRVAVANETGTWTRRAVMGVPYPVREGAHDLDHGALEGGGVALEYASGPEPAPCASFAFPRANMSSLAGGRIVHLLVLWDPELPLFLSRPIDASTRVVPLNAYLAREGEDAARVARALDPRAGPAELVPGVALAAGALLLALPPPRGSQRAR